MKKILILIMLIFMFCPTVLAQEPETFSNTQIENAKKALPNDSVKELRQFNLFNFDSNTIFSKILDLKNFKFDGIIRTNIALLTKILIVLCVCLIASAFAEGKYFSESTINIIAVLSIMVLVLGNIKGQILQTTQVLTQLDVFSKMLMPAVMTSVMMTGQIMAVSSIGSLLTLSFFIGFISKTLVGLLYIYIAIITINSCSENLVLTRAAELIKTFIQGSLKFFLTLFIAYNSVSVVISATSSTALIKTAKFAVSGSVPLVGGIISDATEAFLSSAVLIKNSVGIFGLAGILSICFYPILRSALSFFIFKVGSSLICILSENSILKLVDGISNTLNMLLAMLVSASVAFFFQIVVIIMFVRGGL